MRSDGKKNSCFRLVFIESFSRFRRFYWIILMILSVIFRGDSFCAFGAILLMLLFPIYIIRCKNASGREKGEKMKKNAFFLKILFEKFGGTEKMYYLCTRIWETMFVDSEMSPTRKVGWVAETTSLLNWRAGYRTGGSNPPPSANMFQECTVGRFI